MSFELDADLAIDGKDAIGDGTLDKLLAAGGVDAFAVQVHFPLAETHSSPVPFGQIDAPINDAGTGGRAAVIHITRRHQVDFKVVLNPRFKAVTANLHAQATCFKVGLVCRVESRN